MWSLVLASALSCGVTLDKPPDVSDHRDPAHGDQECKAHGTRLARSDCSTAEAVTPSPKGWLSQLSKGMERRVLVTQHSKLDFSGCGP